MICGNCGEQTDENAGVCEYCGIDMAKSKKINELMNERDELKEQTAQMRKNWILKNRKLSTKQRVSALVSLVVIVVFFFYALDYIGRSQRAFEQVKKYQELVKNYEELKSENNILLDELDTQDSSLKSEDLAQEEKNKIIELNEMLEKKLAEDFKKPELVSTGDHLKDIEIGNYRISFNEADNDDTNIDWAMKVSNGNKLVKTIPSFYFSRPIQAKNGDASLFLFQGFTGGAHCCFSLYPAVYDRQKLRFGNELDLRDIEIDDNNMFEKDGQLYLFTLDTRFAYFYSGFANSGIMWYPSFYRFDSRTAQLVPANNEFKDYYQILYEGMDDEISKWRNGNPENIYRDWLPWLTARSVNGLMAGNSGGNVWKEFNDDFDYFVKYHKPEEIKDKIADQVKKEILEKLKL